jgi:hypothetical protein
MEHIMTHTKQCLSVHDRGHRDLAPVLDIVGSWAVTTYGVENLDAPHFRIPTYRLLEDWEGVLDATPWAVGSWYAGALRAGRLLHGLIEQEPEDFVPEYANEILADFLDTLGTSR